MAVMIKNGFDSLDQRFDKLEDKQEKMDEHLPIVQGKLDKALYKEFDRLETRVKHIEQHLGLKTASP